jgi:hypothetical protein
MDDFKLDIDTARQRAQIRKHNADESDSLSKASDPGKLKRQEEWLVWSRSLTNYLSTILGHDGVPLSYVIRENNEPDYEEEEDFDFEQLSIKCASLVGVVYKTDARKVHQLIHGFVQGETAETWIKPKEKRQDGRLDYKALQAHYGGEGNKSVRIKEAEILRNSLHYKNERAMSFEKFLTNMQAMFTGFEDNDKILTDSQKIRLLFQKVQSPSMTQVKNALQVSYDLDKEGEVNYSLQTAWPLKQQAFLIMSPTDKRAELAAKACQVQHHRLESKDPTVRYSQGSTRISKASLRMTNRQSSTKESV